MKIYKPKIDSPSNKTGQKIEEIYAERWTEGPTDKQLINYNHVSNENDYRQILSTNTQDTGISHETRAIYDPASRSWKLIRNGNEEIVLRVQGVICEERLPPIIGPRHM